MLLFLFAGDASSSITAAGDAIREPAIIGTPGEVSWPALLASTLGEELLPRLSGLAVARDFEESLLGVPLSTPTRSRFTKLSRLLQN